MEDFPVTTPADHFSLNLIKALLAGYKPPDGPFDPAGAWRQRFKLYSLAGVKGSEYGTLQLERAPARDGHFTLAVEHIKSVASLGTHRVQSKILCRTDALASPVEWTLTGQPAGRETISGGGADWVQQGRAADGQLTIETAGAGRRELPISGPLTTNWGVMEAVGRLPRAAGAPLAFTMIDRLDMVVTGQTLTFRETANVRLNPQSAPLMLHAWDHLGQGILPWTYWVDEPGRLLFITSGLQAMILDEAGMGME